CNSGKWTSNCCRPLASILCFPMPLYGLPEKRSMPATHQTTPDQRPRLGISACLTGLPVRYDGTDKRSGAFFEYIAPYVELYPLCPESAIGMPTPRPPIDLVQTANGIIAQGKADPTLNPTQSLQDLAERTAEQPLDGFILTQRSPSCGLGS